MKKYLAIALLGLMMALVQPALANCGCPVSINPCQPVCPACPVCPQQIQPVCPACPVCPPKVVYQPVLQQVQPVIQTVVEPVLSYRYRQIATCPSCNPCNQCGITGAAMPLYPQTIMYGEKHGFWSDFLGFD